MTSGKLVQLPSMIDSDAVHAEFRAQECRECGEIGPIAQVQNPVWWQWGDAHHDTTGHRRIYQWTLTRNTGQITTIGALRPKRRGLGKGIER